MNAPVDVLAVMDRCIKSLGSAAADCDDLTEVESLKQAREAVRELIDAASAGDSGGSGSGSTYFSFRKAARLEEALARAQGEGA